MAARAKQIRANWKGFLKLEELSCPVALYTAASSAERIAFHLLNRKSGQRVKRVFLDSGSGKPVTGEDQVKGYEAAPDDYLVLEPEEIAAALPDSDKTLAIQAFIPCAEIDEVYLDRPYYLAPADAGGLEAYDLILRGLKAARTAALAQTVLFRRVRKLLIRPGERGLIATTLNFDYEVRSAEEAFAEIPARKIKGEMLALARHIIKTKSGSFDPAGFEDRYEAALAALVKAKAEGRPIKRPKPAARGKVVDLMEALRESAGKTAPKSRRKAG